MTKAKHTTMTVLFGGLGLLSVVVASLAARHLKRPLQSQVGVRQKPPAREPDDAIGNVDICSVAGEEDPGAAVDSPAPSPPPSPTI